MAESKTVLDTATTRGEIVQLLQVDYGNVLAARVVVHLDNSWDVTEKKANMGSLSARIAARIRCCLKRHVYADKNIGDLRGVLYYLDSSLRLTHQDAVLGDPNAIIALRLRML